MRSPTPAVVVLLCMCFLVGGGCMTGQSGTASLDLVSDQTGLQLPAETNMVGSYYEFGPGQGRYLGARLEMSEDAAAALVSTIPDATKEERQITDDSLRRKSEWWRPDALVQGRGVSHVRQNGDVVFILTGKQAGKTTVYVLVSGG